MSGKGATAAVLYPRKEGGTFDMAYYLSTHMPLVSKTWTKHGLKSYSVTTLGEGQPYSVSCFMEFESSEALGKALSDPSTKAVTDDVANFSNAEPVVIFGEIAGKS